jgi:hypothetical protein
MDNTSKKSLKTQSIIFGIEILILDSKENSEFKYHFLDAISL